MEIDHCDPQKSMREHELERFGDHPARRWINQFLHPIGPMIDLFRHFYPDEKGAANANLLTR
jgi:AP endonuclease-2